MAQGGHLLGRPRGTWLDGGWAMTTTWLGSGRGICSPLVAFSGTPRGSESPSLSLPGCGSPARLSLLAPVSASSARVLRGAPPFPSDSMCPRQHGVRPLPAAAPAKMDANKESTYQTGDTGSIPGLERRRKWRPTPVFLPGKSHGQRSLGGYSR